MAYRTDRLRLVEVIDEYYCTSRADIAAVTGWSVSKVGTVLGSIRSDRGLDVFIPHVERGRAGNRLYQVIRRGEEEMENDNIQHLLSGAFSTYRSIATIGENESWVLEAAADILELISPIVAGEFRRVATVAAGVAAMTPTGALKSMLEDLEEEILTPSPTRPTPTTPVATE
jgi:hypothetical protein